LSYKGALRTADSGTRNAPFPLPAIHRLLFTRKTRRNGLYPHMTGLFIHLGSVPPAQGSPIMNEGN